MNNNDDLETTMNAIFSDTDDTEREPEVVEVINDELLIIHIMETTSM